MFNIMNTILNSIVYLQPTEDNEKGDILSSLISPGQYMSGKIQWRKGKTYQNNIICFSSSVYNKFQTNLPPMTGQKQSKLQILGFVCLFRHTCQKYCVKPTKYPPLFQD